LGGGGRYMYVCSIEPHEGESSPRTDNLSGLVCGTSQEALRDHGEETGRKTVKNRWEGVGKGVVKWVGKNWLSKKAGLGRAGKKKVSRAEKKPRKKYIVDWGIREGRKSTSGSEKLKKSFLGQSAMEKIDSP